MKPNKPYNMEMPASQLGGGRNLDDGCGSIEQAATPAMDKSSIPQAEGGLGVERNLRGITVKGELAKARKAGRFFESPNQTVVNH